MMTHENRSGGYGAVVDNGGATEPDNAVVEARYIPIYYPPISMDTTAQKVRLLAAVAAMLVFMTVISGSSSSSKGGLSNVSAGVLPEKLYRTEKEIDLTEISGSGCPYAKQRWGISQPPPPPPSEELNKLLGPLAALVGTWEGSGGLSVASVPKRNSHPEDPGDFELVVRPYKETITFSPLGDPVRNRGGFIEQYSGVITYYKEGRYIYSTLIKGWMAVLDFAFFVAVLKSTTSIILLFASTYFFFHRSLVVIATDDDPGAIHVENGMLFYLSNILEYGTGKPAMDSYAAPYPIARSATVPHGNVAFMFGSHETSEDAPTIHDIDSRAPNSGAKHPSKYNQQFEDSPYEFAANPNGMLLQAIESQKIVKTTHFFLDSKNQGSVTNTPFINSNANTTGFKCDIWIETVVEEDGSITEQLQYR